MTKEKQEHWRWFARPFWHHCASMYQESYLATFAVHEFERYHHLRACIYFCTATLEAFLNERMRLYLTKTEKTEEFILQKLRNGRLLNKIINWPEKLGSNLGVLPSYALKYIEEMINIRHEVTHPKNKDHSILKDLDEINPFWCVKSTSEYVATVFEGFKEQYPYWLLGWNIVGSNHECQAIEINNHQFLYCLKGMGLFTKIPGDVWHRENMWSLDNFQRLQKFLEVNAPDIEPRNALMPKSPRLTRRWWDKDLIKAA